MDWILVAVIAAIPVHTIAAVPIGRWRGDRQAARLGGGRARPGIGFGLEAGAGSVR